MTSKLQLLTFTLGEEVYAIDVSRTREVVEFAKITPIPKTPSWIRGVLNLRGTIVPVLDLKQKLSMGATERSLDACILILDILSDGERTLLGVLADSVKEVLELDSSEIEPPPNFGTKLSTEYIKGVGRQNGGLFLVIDIEEIFVHDEIELAHDAANKSDSDDALSVSGGQAPPDTGMESQEIS